VRVRLCFRDDSPDMYLVANQHDDDDWRDGSRRNVFLKIQTFRSEFAILAHPHLLVQHLLKQLEIHKRDKQSRSRRPEWLSVFVHQVAALFEPLSGVGRVGSQCEFADDRWEVRLYLGSTEIVGGKNDGYSQLLSYELDFVRLRDAFTRLDEFRWNVGASSEGGNSSFVVLRGLIDQYPVCLKIYSRPPKEAGPAFRQNADGTLDAVGI
jgi:hypothetical protein